MAVDPVCGMTVDPSKTPYKTVYKGKVYYFCSSICKGVFEEDPERYLTSGPVGMPKPKHGGGFKSCFSH